MMRGKLLSGRYAPAISSKRIPSTLTIDPICFQSSAKRAIMIPMAVSEISTPRQASSIRTTFQRFAPETRTRRMNTGVNTTMLISSYFKFASVWAERGWLSNIQVTADKPPKRLGRRVTRTLVRMAGLEGKYKKIYQDLPEAAQSNTTSVDENG